jgi:predicted nucleic acid-binding protein
VLIGRERGTLMLMAERGWFTPVWSAFIIAEMVRIRTKHAIQNNEDMAVYRGWLNHFISRMSSYAIYKDHTKLRGGNWTWLKDPDDEPILATALLGRAQYVVSNDRRHFPPPDSNPYPSVLNPVFGSVYYVTAQEFIDEMVRQRGSKRVAAALATVGLPALPSTQHS